MIRTSLPDLSPLRIVAENIINDIRAGRQRDGSEYTTLANSLLSDTPISLHKVQDDLANPNVIEAALQFKSIKLVLGGRDVRSADKNTLIVMISGVLCHELVHKFHRGMDPTSFEMAMRLQNEWRLVKRAQANASEWLYGYYGTVYEFEAHAEQIACEIWTGDSIRNSPHRNAVQLAAITDSATLDRIKGRLGYGNGNTLIDDWFNFLEVQVNAALATWSNKPSVV